MSLRLAILVSHPIQYFAPLHREVARRQEVDLRVFFCCRRGLDAYHDEHFQVAVQWDIPLLEGYAHEFLPISKEPENLANWSVDNPEVGRALDRFDPDVVLVHGYSMRTSWRVARWTRQHGKPLMLYSDSNIRTPVPRWKRPLKKLVVGSFYRRVDGALYVGDSNRAYHASFGVPEERLFPGVIPVDRNRLLRSVPDTEAARKAVRDRHGIPRDAFVVLLCGKYVAWKSPLHLVMAAHNSARAGKPIWALLVGEGPERHRIQQFCAAHGVTNVTLTGFVNQSAIGEYYAASDVLALTSERDAHPLAVTEAACFGLPVVISDHAGCVGENDSASPGRNALVYPWGDLDRLQQCIEQLCCCPELYGQMSKAALEISETQDVGVAAAQLVRAALQLQKMGPR